MTAPLSVPYSLIPAKPVHWFHEGFVPVKHVTVVLGPAGTSKGITVIDYAARATSHRPAPGEAEPYWDGPRDVIIVTPEDDANEAVAWRLKGAGAITDRVHNLTVFPDGHHFTLPTDIKRIPQAIEEIEFDLDANGKRTIQRYAADGKPRKVGMLILDPLLALAETEMTRRSQARPVMEELEDMSKTLSLVTLLTHHTNADGRAASSRGITETTRNMLSLSKPPKAPDDSPLRVLTVAKTNIGRTGSEMRYGLAGTIQEPHLVWEAEITLTDQAASASRGYEVGEPEPEAAPEPVPAMAEATEPATVPYTPPATFRPVPPPEPEHVVKMADTLPVMLMPEPRQHGFTDRRKWRRTAA